MIAAISASDPDRRRDGESGNGRGGGGADGNGFGSPPKPSAQGAKERVNILVVDDLQEKLLTMRVILETLDENVVCVQSGRDALRALLDQDFAVILLDVNMPEMDGFETAQMIRQRKRSEHTPIIFITAFSDEVHALEGYSLGAVDYILSPVVPEILRTKVGVFVDLFRKTEQIRSQAEQRIALARAEAARAAAEENTRRAAFLGEATAVLSRSLDHETTVESFARVLVPALGASATVTILDDLSRPALICQATIGPTQETRVVRLDSLSGVGASDAEAIERTLTISTGASSRPPTIAARSKNDTRSLLCIPLFARGKVLGAVTLGKAPGQADYDENERVLADDLASRAAIAIDNARLYRQIQERDRRKNEFLAMLAHELRNPLAPIVTAIEILRRKGANEPAVANSREVIQRQVDQLVRLVDDLLDVSRITSGKIRLHATEVDVGSVVGIALETTRPLVESRRHELTVSLPEQPVFVNADSTRIAQILSNLINNAAKYTDEGGHIWLTVEATAREVIMRVRDTGMGIPHDMLHEVFDLFAQVTRSLDRSQGGLGIGLTLVRRLVELHGGTVEAKSAGPGQGSEFIVRLPRLEVVEMEAEVEPGTEVSPGVEEGARILIVDDNRDAADTLATLLESIGHRVRVAYDGKEALAAAEVQGPEIVLLDIGLPEVDGYEVARRLRAREDGKALSIIAISGYGQEADRNSSRQAGMDHHIVKPVEPEELINLIQSLRARPISAS